MYTAVIAFSFLACGNIIHKCSLNVLGRINIVSSIFYKYILVCNFFWCSLVPAHLIGSSCVSDALGRYMFSESLCVCEIYIFKIILLLKCLLIFLCYTWAVDELILVLC